MNPNRTIIFYDGECALCHRFIKFVLRHDEKVEFYFSPLQGETIKKLVAADQLKSLPDTVVVRAFAGELFLKSDGTIYVLKRLGPISRATAGFLSIIPRFIRNFGYDVIAAVRKKIFGTKTDYCPLVPSELRERFLP